MSIDYRSGIARGYKITHEQLMLASEKYEQSELCTDLNPDITDYLYERDFLICLNGWSADPEYIVGYELAATCEDGGTTLLTELKHDGAVDAQLKTLYRDFFTENGEKVEPVDMLYCSVT